MAPLALDLATEAGTASRVKSEGKLIYVLLNSVDAKGKTVHTLARKKVGICVPSRHTLHTRFFRCAGCFGKFSYLMLFY